MSMQRLCVSRAVLGFALLTAVAACNPDGAVAPGDEENPQGTPVTIALVSAPSAVNAAARLHAAVGDLSDGGTYAFVSVSPGSVPGVTASITNRTRDRQLGTTSRIKVPVTNGGLDPVPIPASAGDTLQIEFLAPDQTVLLAGAAVVPKVRPPTIVRTNPRPGKKDVPLNTRIEIVFSEPVDPGTITADNIEVAAGGVVIGGALVRMNAFTVEFVPVELLRPETSYQIVIRTGVRNLSGVALESEFSADFVTELAPPVTTPPETTPPGTGTGSLCATATRCFAFAREGAVFTAAFDDSPPARLVEDATRPAWSADGSMIAFTRPNTYALAKWQMCISERDGTRVRCAVSAEDGIVVGGPSWSPDGTLVAFSVFVYSCPAGQCGQLGGSFSRLKMLDTRTMQVTSVGTLQVQSLAWSPDGRRIALAAWGAGPFGRGGLHVMNADGSNVRFLGASLGSYSAAGIAWSPDGGRLALALTDENACPWYCDTALGVVNADGTGLQVLATARTSFPARSEDRYIDFPAWSPDGSRLAYTVSGSCYESEPGCPTEIRGRDFESGDSYVLVPNAAGGSWPRD